MLRLGNGTVLLPIWRFPCERMTTLVQIGLNHRNNPRVRLQSMNFVL